jgi:endonuclease G
MLKNEHSRATASVFHRIVSFTIAAILVLQHLLIISPKTAIAAAPTELFFSEYIEGSSNNKALEIYNGTGSAVNLATGGYVVQMYFNGATTVGTSISLTGTIASGDVFVLAQSNANSVILAQADQTSNSNWFNGDDAIVLRKGGTSGQVVDSIGQVGFDPGTQWGAGLTSTEDNTLRRKSSVSSGDTNPTNVFNPNDEWEGFDNDTFNGLGSHTFTDNGTPTPTPTSTPTPTPSPTPTFTPTPTPSPSPTPIAPVNHVVISQIYGGGGNSGALYTNDYVELYNPTSSAVNLSGWSLQYASAAGSGWDGSKQPLGGIIGPGEYYLVSLAAGGANGQPLPAANISGELNLSGSSGKIALVSNGDSLSGECPIGDVDIIDFVGYGTANCSEGSVKAPSPSDNTEAIFRKASGAQDTNVNGTDFVRLSASPQRTAPIVEIGPSVLSTDPRSNFTNSPRDASLTISFTEPIFVDPQWFTVTCSVTGSHNDATISASSNGKSYVITPNVNFQAGEQCSATINKDSVHDVDTDDTAPDTDNLAANFTWSFTIAIGAAPAYTPDVHLTMGNPTDATADVNNPNNYLMEKPEYALSYNRERGTANWVSWHLDDTWVGSLPRVDTFRPDPQVPSDWYRVQASDYFGSGFDRGHMVPNADRDPSTSTPINQATFLMTNMIPQAPDNNQGPWANLENYLRTLLPANEIYIVAGGAGVGGTGSNGFTEKIANGQITVPAQTWKVALVIPKANGDDVARVTPSARTIAVIMPNTQGIRNEDWQKYLVSVDQVESLTGYDFFENLSDAVENSVEAGVNGNNPPGNSESKR